MFTTPDLMTFLEAEYARCETTEDGREFIAQTLITDENTDHTTINVVKSFANFCRVYLAGNQPSNVVYLARGLGVRLQQGQTVSFTIQSVNETVMRDNGIPITRPVEMPGVGLLPSQSIPVTGGYRI